MRRATPRPRTPARPSGTRCKRRSTALSALESDERKALLLKKQFGFGYADIAQMLYDDRHAARRVDTLISGALRKIRRAEKRYRDGRAEG